MSTTQTDFCQTSNPKEKVEVSLTKQDWDRITNAVSATGMEREAVMPLVDRIRIQCKLPPRSGVEYKLNVYA